MADNEGGDPACWVDLVCPECGQMREGPEHLCQRAVGDTGHDEGAEGT